MSVRYRVPQERVLTFKEYADPLAPRARGHRGAARALAREPAGAAGRVGRHHRPQRRRQDDAHEGHRPRAAADSGSVAVRGPGRAAARARRRLRHGADRARERLPERRHAAALAQGDAAPAAGHRRVRRARALHRRAAADLLDGHGRPGWGSRWRPTSSRRSCSSTRSSRSATSSSSRSASTRIEEFLARGATLVLVSHSPEAGPSSCASAPSGSTRAGW